MPVKKCQIEGKDGFKWGDEGKCYTGPDAKKKAIEQGIAIEGGDISDYKKKSVDGKDRLSKS